MKKFNFLLVVAVALMGGQAIAQESGGPDAWGYKWRSSRDTGSVGKPAFNWVDITTKPGVQQITDLTDDNSHATMSNIGFDFQYYFTKVNKARVGSNGWIAFNDNVKNIAPAFPAIPTAANPNNYIAAFMCDLTFAGAGNVGKCYTWSNNLDTFIVSYVNVPNFKRDTGIVPPASLSYYGSHTFQVILSGKDSSITFQYGDMFSRYNNTDATSLQAGIENVSGSIGLKAFTNKIPKDSTTIRYTFPRTTTLKVKDAATNWNQNAENGAFFRSLNGKPLTFKANVSNDGNDTAKNVTVRLDIRKGTVKRIDTISIPQLLAGADSTVEFLDSKTRVNFNVAGASSIEVTTTATGDANANNAVSKSKYVVVDTTKNDIILDYTTGNTTGAAGTFGLTGEDAGCATYFEPPFYPAYLKAVEFNVTDGGTAGDPVASTFRIYVLDNSRTRISADTTALGDVPSQEFYTKALKTPLKITEGGVYIQFFTDNDSVQLQTIASTNTSPASQRTFESIGGSLSPFRNGETQDFLLNAVISKELSGVDTKKSLGFSLGQSFPNPAANTATIPYSVERAGKVSFTITNLMGQIVEQHGEGFQTSGSYNYTVNTANYAAGTYFYTMTVNGASFTKKMMVK